MNVYTTVMNDYCLLINIIKCQTVLIISKVQMMYHWMNYVVYDDNDVFLVTFEDELHL